jgi:hypothetical protein
MKKFVEAERENRDSTVLREDSPKLIKPETVKEKPVATVIIPNTMLNYSPSPPAQSIKSKASKTKSMRKTVNKKSDRTGKQNDTEDSSLNQIDKIDLIADSKYKDSVSISKSPRTDKKKSKVKADELTQKLTEQASEFKHEINELKTEVSH